MIPSYEPDRELLNLCEKLCAIDLTNIILVDDGSGEEYRYLFDKAQQKYGCTVLRNAVNQGKGRALKNAFNYILNQENSGIIGCVTADSDGQHTPTDILKCIQMLEQNPTSLVLGCRTFTGEDVPFKSRFGNELTRKIFSFLCGIQVSDTQTGLRGISTDFMRFLLNVSGERFEYEMNMLIACKDKVDIIEVPIETIYDSKVNHKTHFDPIHDSIKIYKVFGRMFIKYIFASLSSCVLDLILFTLFCGLLKNQMGILYVAVATVLARILSASYNYLLNYKVVFQSTQNHTNAAMKYAGLAVAQMVGSALLVTVGVHILQNVSELPIKLVVDTILFFVSYYVQRKYIF